LKLVFGFGAILSLGGALFLLDGAWQLYQNYVHRTRWPGANAHVQACSIYEYFDYASRPRTLRKKSYVLCKLNYPAGGVERETNVQVGDAITTYDNTRASFLGSQLSVATMQGWITRHPPGSYLAIRYDPSNPATVVSAGENRELRLATPYDRLWFGIIACAGGLVIVAIGRLS
jgi:hypothetical protein